MRNDLSTGVIVSSAKCIGSTIDDDIKHCQALCSATGGGDLMLHLEHGGCAGPQVLHTVWATRQHATDWASQGKCRAGRCHQARVRTTQSAPLHPPYQPQFASLPVDMQRLPLRARSLGTLRQPCV
ncbi:hypothetical protein J3459_010992 [Metarhizium acridum]|nr:hypothetical protein J3459_011037 [Metarhizium acridum]KAG8420535.1 hypothetical protein J3459_010992 [Metarhizium acridum]